MARSAARGGSRKRPRDHGPSSPPSRDEVQALAASEVTARLQQIADSRRPRRSGDPRPAGRGESAPLAADIRGVRVTDHGLIGRGRPTTRAELISVTTNPDPERPDSVVMRLDGWEGHLVLVLPRDRAALLAKKLEQAVEMSRDWTARDPGAPPAIGPVVDSSRPPTSPMGRRSHGPPRGRGARGFQEATDRVLDDLAEVRFQPDIDPEEGATPRDDDA